MSICVYLWTIFLCVCANAQTLAPNAPGRDAQWASAGKQGVGTSAGLESKIWFTLQGGAMSEVYYPDVTAANVHKLEFFVVNSATKKVETETEDAIHEVKVARPDSLTFQQINTAKSGAWKITKTYTIDIERETILIRVSFESKTGGNLFVYYDPSLGNSGMHDTAWTQGGALLAQEGDKASALIANPGFNRNIDNKVVAEGLSTNGFLGVNDGLTQLKNKPGDVNYKSYDRAENGNVVQVSAIISTKYKNSFQKGSNVMSVAAQPLEPFTIALSFGKTPDEALKKAKLSLEKGFEKCLAEYEKGWSDYVKTIPKVDAKFQAQFNMAAMVLKAHEDKTNRGANIASLTVPWGGGENANENNVGGYHLVWSRDLYQVATAYMALGDREAATRALDFVFNTQQKPDGSFPQNSFLDGKPFWGSLQLDEVAYPLILAYQLGRNDKATYEKHIKRAADFIVKNGPRTPQERWEEESGFSPSTIAAEIAGLVCAAEIARKNADEASALIYLATADDWARNVERWTATTTGKYGDGNYYLRITGSGRPDAGERIELNNGAGFYDEREIVDAGFLELVRLGIKSPDDALIEKSVNVIDQLIKVKTPNGDAFYRYNHDGYGEMDDGRRWNWDGKYTGKGRLWALLSGERGQYELARAQQWYDNWLIEDKERRKNPNYPIKHVKRKWLAEAQGRLDAMLGFANEGLMIPEQIWDKQQVPQADSQFSPNLKFGEGTGSATPLAWSSAQFIRLAVNLQSGKNLDTPDVVYNRYVKTAVPRQASNFGGMDEEVVLPVKAGEKFRFTRQAAPNAKVAISFQDETKLVPVNEKGEFSVEITAPEKEEIAIVAVVMPDGSSAFERVKLYSSDKSKRQNFSAETIKKIKNAKTSPLIENGKAILFYRGEAKSVSVAGDMTAWNPGRILMQDVGENLKAVELDLAPATRAEYKLIVDGNWMLDAANPNKLDNGLGEENSVIAMPEYKPTAWDRETNEPSKLETLEIDSKVYGEKRQIKVYVPRTFVNLPASSNAAAQKMLPALYLQDGTDYVNRAKAIQTQQNLVKAGKIKPFIMVFVDYKDRTKEYWATDEYAKFLATEVVPAIDAKYNTIKNRDGRAILGASLGGITSVWTGLKYPETFARIGGQSSSFWVDNERVVGELAKLDASKSKFRFYFDDGTLEGTEDSRRVNVMLRGKGFPVVYNEGETGHNWTSWRDRLADAFVALWQN
ncbi:MAG TPA: glycoside hydrolase family 15 protein [Pyrinomonadaceae bacterium]